MRNIVKANAITAPVETGTVPSGSPRRLDRRQFLRAGAHLAVLLVLNETWNTGRAYAAAPPRTYGSAPYGRILYMSSTSLVQAVKKAGATYRIFLPSVAR